jgi:hypothetical protein
MLLRQGCHSLSCLQVVLLAVLYILQRLLCRSGACVPTHMLLHCLLLLTCPAGVTWARVLWTLKGCSGA